MALALGLPLLACEQPVEHLAPRILLTLPHDTAAYTQGLVYSRRMLWESTGRRGHSTVQKVDPETGEVLLSRALPDSLFGEGLALVDYEGEGRGLCYDGSSLYMTNGSDSTG